jgi:TonB-linked SusC/RagA family outer membrane protein
MKQNLNQFLWKILMPVITVLVFNFSLAQETINGTVSDENGPLPGATILIKGTTNGTQSDFDGNYTLSGVSPGDTLEFSYIGYEMSELVYDQNANLQMILVEDTKALDEVVVVGYGTQKKSSLTGSVVKVDNEQLTRVSVPNATELLAGRVAGIITKQTSGIPGADNTTLNVRGFGTPLILVDGIEMSLDRIDPNDIESINTLKDASAAIYGARAGNGVILITTKRGRVGKPTISYTGTMSFQQPVVWRNNVNAGQFVEMQNEGGAASYTPEEIQAYKNGDPGYESYDWERTIFRTWAPMNQHSLTASGGSEKVKFFTSLGNLYQSGSYRSGDLNYGRTNIRSNVDFNINDNLSVGLDLSYRKDKRSEPGMPQNNIYNAFIVSEPILHPVIPGRPELAANSGGGFGNRGAYGGSQRSLSGFLDIFGEVFNGRIQMDYKIPQVEGLSVKGTMTYLSDNRQTKDLNKRMPVYQYDQDTQQPVQVGQAGSDNLSESLRQFKRIYPTISVSYENVFGDHEVKGLLLTETIDEETINFGASRRDLLTTDLPFLNLGSELGIQNSGNALEFGRSSVVGRVNYGYKNKYFLESSFRYDASSNFAEESRWGFFPSVSAAWRLSEEDFLKDVDFVNSLKVRMSFSETGNDNIGLYRYLEAFSIQEATSDFTSGPYLFGNSGLSTAISTTGLANPNVTWRELTTYNFGIDAMLFDGLLGIELDIFYRDQKGIFATPLADFPSTFGATLPQENQNSTSNRGFDLVLSHKNKVGELSYDVALSMGFAREKYEYWPVDRDIRAYAENDAELNDPAFIERFNLIQLRNGNWVNRNIGYKTDGIFMDQAEIDAHPVDQSLLAGGTGNSRVIPGDIRYVDLNGDNYIDWRDQDQIGKGGLPDMTYGINLNASYKNFSLSMLFQGATGFNFTFGNQIRNILVNNVVPYKFQYDYRWTPDPNNPAVNINPNAQLPASTAANANANNTQVSDFWVQDGTYLRLKNLNIGYDIPSNIRDMIGVDQFRLFVSGSNLITWNNLGIYKGSFDSEGPSNQDGTTYPLIKTISYGINISL